MIAKGTQQTQVPPQGIPQQQQQVTSQVTSQVIPQVSPQVGPQQQTIFQQVPQNVYNQPNMNPQESSMGLHISPQTMVSPFLNQQTPYPQSPYSSPSPLRSFVIYNLLFFSIIFF